MEKWHLEASSSKPRGNVQAAVELFFGRRILEELFFLGGFKSRKGFLGPLSRQFLGILRRNFLL